MCSRSISKFYHASEFQNAWSNDWRNASPTEITVTHVSLGSRSKLSRDPDDNIMIATARSGKASFLVTNDLDLLEISLRERARLRLEIVTPAELLARIRAG